MTTGQPDRHAAFLIETDGRTVWVTGSDGSCIGRFGRLGVDVHRPFEQQLDGEGECLTCTHGPTGDAEWRLFVVEMLRHHGVCVDDAYRPAYAAPRPETDRTNG